MWLTICQGKPWRGEIRNKTKQGEYYWVDTVIAPVMDEKNKIYQFISIRNVITQQKKYEEILKESEILYREAFLIKHPFPMQSWISSR